MTLDCIRALQAGLALGSLSRAPGPCPTLDDLGKILSPCMLVLLHSPQIHGAGTVLGLSRHTNKYIISIWRVTRLLKEMR